MGRYQFKLNMLLNEEISTWNGMHLKLFIFARRVKPYNYKARDYASRFFCLTASPTQCSIALSFPCTVLKYIKIWSLKIFWFMKCILTLKNPGGLRQDIVQEITYHFWMEQGFNIQISSVFPPRPFLRGRKITFVNY